MNLTAECPCGAARPYADCCAPLIHGARPAETAQALMRSRYTAHVMGEIDYLIETLAPDHPAGWTRATIEAWAKGSTWLGLEVHEVEGGGEADEVGTVAFTATYRARRGAARGALRRHHERSTFHRVDGAWRYLKGEALAAAPAARPMTQAGRNDPCPCGSQKKFKKCCGR